MEEQRETDSYEEEIRRYLTNISRHFKVIVIRKGSIDKAKINRPMEKNRKLRHRVVCVFTYLKLIDEK